MYVKNPKNISQKLHIKKNKMKLVSPEVRNGSGCKANTAMNPSRSMVNNMMPVKKVVNVANPIRRNMLGP